MSTFVTPRLAKWLKSSDTKPPDHPFGRENEVCVGQLFKFFCNNLYLGQWGLARACVRELHQQRELLGHNIHELLLDVIENPYGYSLGNDGVRTPHHLSWLCLHEYARLLEEDEPAGPTPQVETLQKEVEFRLLLVGASEFCDATIINELYLCYKDLNNYPSGGCKETRLVPSLSAPCLHALGRVLEADPVMGHTLVERLSMPGAEQLTAHNEQLQLVHLKCLFNALSALQAAEQQHAAALAARFYHLLALFDLRPEALGTLTPFLEQLSWAVVAGQVSKHGVYSALLGRKTPHLVATFSQAHHACMMQVRAQSGSGNVDELSDTSNLVLALCEDGDRQEAWKELFLISLKHEKHFLDLIMETAMCLVKAGEFSRLSAMLAPPELRPLHPLVLLVGWDHCPDVAAAQQLLKALGDWQMDGLDGTVMEQACQRLAYQVELVQWCLEKTSSASEFGGALLDEHQTSLLLRGLETHSVLTMLHCSKQLAHLTHEQVVHTLTERPHMHRTDGPSSLKKAKSVRFSADIATDPSIVAPDVAEDAVNEVHVETERDLAIYRSYRALHAFMEAMHFCADTVNWESYVHAHNQLQSVHRSQVRATIRQKASQHGADSPLTRSGSVGNRSGMTQPVMRSWSQASASSTGNGAGTDARNRQAETELGEFQELYEKRVVQRLSEGRELLSGLYPLKLRVEVLENIFSLLFLTNEHISEERTLGQSDSGEEGAVSESRNGSQAGSSHDNLSVLLESTTEKSCASSPNPGTTPTALTFEVPPSDEERSPVQIPFSIDTTMTTTTTTSAEAVSMCDPSYSKVTTKETAVGTLSISKTDLKDTSSDFPTAGCPKKASGGNQSTNSACSMGSVYKVGFAANPYMVRDLLTTLKHGLNDLNTAKYQLSSQQQPDAAHGAVTVDVDCLRAQEATLNRHLTSSIDSSQLQQRLSRLSQYVSEACWRFQLVTPVQMPAEFGKIRTEKALSEDDSQSDDESAFHSDDEANMSRHKRKRRYTHGGTVSNEESDCKPTTTTTDDSFASHASHAARRRKRRRTQCLMLGRKGVMPLMLSDKATLLNRCLKRSKYSQAQQVVKMFGLERSGNAAEVMFAEHYAIAVKTLQNINSSKSGSRPTTPGGRFIRPFLHGGKLGVRAIADVAAAGMVTVSATTTVDQILSLNLLPRFSTESLDMMSSSASPLATHVDPSHVPAMVILDLACAASCVYESTNNLAQMMSQRLPPRPENPARPPSSKVGRIKRSMSLESVSGEPRKLSQVWVTDGGGNDNRMSSLAGAPLPGVRGFMDQVLQWVHLGRMEANVEVADVYLKRSLNDVLLTASQPLGMSPGGSYGHLMVELGRALRRVQKAVQDAHKQETLSLVQAVRAGRQGDATTAPAGGAHEKPVIRQAMKQLLVAFAKSVPPEGISRQLLKLHAEGSPQQGAYLPRLYDHVKALSCLVHEAHGDKLVASTVEYFQILEEGPTQILGKLIFVKKIPPARLEDVATKLHVNMLQIIINNCCPLVSSRPVLPTPPALTEEERGGKLVLNGCGEGLAGSVQHPGVIVTETLTKLIGFLRDLAELDAPCGVLAPGLLVAAVQDPRYPALTASLAQLRHVDLGLLASREDKLCFYVNLVNLMTLHVLLRQVARQVDRQESRSRHSSFSKFSRQANSLRSVPTRITLGHRGPGVLHDPVDTGLPAGDLEWLLLQMRTAYHVGQLGIVSLFDLKYFILRNGLPAPSSYSGVIKDRCHELDPLDPWRIYGPPPEPRTMFVISEGHVSSPPLQVLSREMVLTQLRSAMKEYLQRTVTVDLEVNMVTLPQLMVWHQCDLATEYGHGGLPCEGLLNLLPTQLDSPLADDLRTLMDRHAVRTHGTTKEKGRDIKVVVRPYIMDYTYTFDFDQFTRLQSSTSPIAGRHRRCASLPWAPTSGASTMTEAPRARADRQEDLFHLTPGGMTYLRSRSELVATLASLVGLVDSLDLQKDLQEEVEQVPSPTGTLSPAECRRSGVQRDGDGSSLSRAISPDQEYGTSLPRNAASSPESTRPMSPESLHSTVGDYTIAQYRYRQQVERLPLLWRHLLQQVVPLEVAQDPDLLNLPPQELLSALCHRELSRDSRTAILVAPTDRRLHDAALTLTRILILQREWLAVVRLLRALPELLLHTYDDLRGLHDLACCCVAYTCGETRDISDTDSNDLWRHLLLVTDVTMRCRTVLSMSQFWPVDIAVELLEACYYGDRPEDDALYAALGERLQQTCIYRRITEAASDLHQKAAHTTALGAGITSASDDERNDEEDGPITITATVSDEIITMTTDDVADLEALCTWQNVVTYSASRPERVLQVLLEANEFDVARKWGKMHMIDDVLHQMAAVPWHHIFGSGAMAMDNISNMWSGQPHRIEESYIGFLLESPTPNHVEAFQVLERSLATDPDGCLSLCEDLLTGLKRRANTAFIAGFLLRHLSDRINKYRRHELELLATGCRMLLCLPKTARDPYNHLVETPLLLLEQLVMNSKIEWVSKVLSMLRGSRSVGPVAGGLDEAACDALLVRYAARALDFPVLQAESSDTTGMVRAESRSSLTSYTSISSQVSSLFSRAAPSGGPMGVAVVASPSSVSSPRIARIPSSTSLTPQRSVSIKARSPTTGTILTPVAGQIAPLPSQLSPPSDTFVMPAEPPPKEMWVPDASASVCMVCGVERFSMFVRRHHCRRCGRVVCASCSTRTMAICGTSARACDQCYKQCFKARDVDEPGPLQRLKDRLSGASSFGSTPVSPDPASGPAPPTVSLLTEYMYVLSSDDEQNDLHREEFYYDQAPSTSLCLSLLELHSSPQACGDTILALCDDVSKHLQPIAPGVRNHEVDYGLVLSMLKYLLFNAKMKLLRAGDNAGVGRCDVYLGRLDLLRQLVAANVSYVPSMQQLTKMDALRRLRDRLIHEERLPLAMDVSTKCGIDPTGVWVAWGMAALRAGDYNSARDKFSHCLKAPVDRNSIHHPTNLLADIIEQLETGPPPSATLAEGLLAPLASLKDLLAEPHMSMADGGNGREEVVTRECVHYLTTYGSHTALVAFYLRQGQMHKALHHILDRRCNREVFVDGLLVPCLAAGKLTHLQDAMQWLDPTLESWAPYLTATCRHLDKARLLQTLYQTQLFIKDYIRAAMTCITYFYQRDAGSYAALSGRVHHLLNAKHHLECYLGDRAWGRTGQQTGGTTLRLIMTPGEVNKYINTISLQIDVTKFLHRYSENLDGVTATMRSTSPTSPTTQRSLPPTLFGSTRMTAEATNLVLLSGNNVNDGFGLAFRIIQDFKLDATFIYVQAARYFSRLHRYSSARQLLDCVKDSGLCTDHSFDDVVTACVRVIADDPAESREADALIKMIRSDASRISAYVVCGKLRSAYLIAVKGERVQDIERIRAAAERTGQAAVKKICDKWLAGRLRAEHLLTRR